MVNKQIPELAYLLTSVERKYGRRIATTTDESSFIDCTGELLSASTLKRLWGYVSLKPIPRLSTLDAVPLHRERTSRLIRLGRIF